MRNNFLKHGQAIVCFVTVPSLDYKHNSYLIYKACEKLAMLKMFQINAAQGAQSPKDFGMPKRFEHLTSSDPNTVWAWAAETFIKAEKL